MTAIAQTFVAPAVPDARAFVGGRLPFGEKLGLCTGIEVGTQTVLAPGVVFDDARERWPWLPEKYKSLMWPSKDHGDTTDTGAFLHFGNVDRDPLAWTSFDDARAELVTAMTAASVSTANLPAANPVVAHPTVADKGQFFGGYISPWTGEVYLCGHSIDLGGSQTRQQQWTARLGDAFEMLPTDPAVSATETALYGPRWPGFSSYGHNGGYAQYFVHRGRLVCRCLRTSAHPITGQIAYGVRDVHWQAEPHRLLFREPAYWGDDRQLVPHGQPISIDGVWWQCGTLRDAPAVGGDTTNGDLVAWPIDDDLTTLLGEPVYLSRKGDTGEHDEIATTNGMPCVTSNSAGELLLYVAGEDSSGNRAISCTKVRPQRRGEYPGFPMPHTNGNYSLPKLIGGPGRTRGKLISTCEGDPKPLAGYNFDDYTTDDLPSGIAVTNRTNSRDANSSEVYVNDLTTAASRGGLTMYGQWDLFLHAPGIAVSNRNAGALHLTVPEVRFATVFGVNVQIGWFDLSDLDGYFVEYRNDSGAANRVRLRHYGEGSEQNGKTAANFGPWLTGQTDRAKPLRDITVSIVYDRNWGGVRRGKMLVYEGPSLMETLELTNVERDLTPGVRLIGSASAASVTIGGFYPYLGKREIGSGE